MTENTDAIVAKVKKLMAMTEDRGATPEEAAAALAKVQAILAKYNLSMAEVQAQSSQDDMTKGFGQVKYMWQAQVWNSIAELNFCRLLYNSRAKTVSLFGREANVEIAKYMGQYVVDRISRYANEEARRQPHEARKLWRRSFKYGAVYEISVKVDEIIEERSRAATEVDTGEEKINLPALASLYDTERHAVQEYLSSLGITSRPGRRTRRRSIDPEGYTRGRQRARDDINLNQQLKGRG